MLSSNLTRAEKEALISKVHRQVLRPIVHDELWAFIEYVMKDNLTGDYLRLKKFHRDWTRILQNEQYIVLAVPMGYGKCVCKDTKIQLVDGSTKEAKNIVSGDRIFAMDSDFKMVHATVSAVTCNGYRDLLKIETQSGRVIKVTPEHRFFILGRGWVRADSLSLDERIATPRSLNIASEPEEEAYANNDTLVELLGYLISEGSLRNNARFTTSDSDILARIRLLAKINGCSVHKDANQYGYNIVCEGQVDNPIITYLRKVGLLGCNSHNKFIPQCVFTSNFISKRYFISALFSGDGTVSKSNKTVSYTSVSRRLIYDVQTLLLHLGIVSQISSRYTRCNGKEFLSYRLNITNKENITKFVSIIKYLYPDYKVKTLMAYTWENTYGGLDGVPVAWKIYQDRKDSWYRKWFGNRVEVNSAQMTSRERLREIAQVEDPQCGLFNDGILHNLAHSDLLWDRVTSIEYASVDLTYDIEVKEHHNFVANNIITHNSTIVSRSYPLWLLGKYPNLRIGLAGESERQHQKSLQAIMNYIVADRDLRDVFSELRPQPDPQNPNRDKKWAVDGIIVKREHISPDYSLEPFGINTTILSARFDVLICDNVLSEKNTHTEYQCSKTNDWFDGVAKSRVLRNDYWFKHYDYEVVDGVVRETEVSPVIEHDSEGNRYVDYIPSDKHYTYKDTIERFEALTSKTVTPSSQIIVIDTSWDCYAAGEQSVICNNSYKNVEDIVPGDIVYDKDWNSVKVVNIHKQHYKGVVYNIRPRYHPVPIKITPKHRLLTNNGYKEVKDITTKDLLIYNINREELSDKQILKYAKESKRNRKYARNTTRITGESARFTKPQLMKHLDDGLSYKQIAKMYNTTKGTIWKWVCVFGLNAIRHLHDRYYIDDSFVLDKRFWRVVGYYLAEGSIDGERASFAFHKDEEEYREYISEFAQDYIIGVVEIRNSGPNCKSIRFSSVQISDFIRKYFGCGSHTKYISKWIEKLPLHLQRELVIGYWQGDGTLNKTGKYAEIASVNYNLLASIQRILLRFNIISNIFKYKNDKVVREINGKPISSCGYVYTLRITASDTSWFFRVDNNYLKVLPQRGFIVFNTLYIPVKSITTEMYEGDIYDLQVEGSNYYIPNIVSHNSRDLLHYLAENKKYTTVMASTDREDVGKGFVYVEWYERYSRKSLDADKADNPIMYDLTRRNQPGSPELEKYNKLMVDTLKQPLFRAPRNWTRIVGMDLAGKARKGTAICTIAISPDYTKKAVLDIQFGKWGAQEKADNLYEVYIEQKPDLVYIEDNAMQEDIVEWLDTSLENKHVSVPVTGVTTSASVNEAMERSLEVELRKDQWIFVMPDDHHESCTCDWCRLFKEIKHYDNWKSNDGFKSLQVARMALRGQDERPRVSIMDLGEDKYLEKEDKIKFTIEDYELYNNITFTNASTNYETIAEYLLNNSLANAKSKWDKDEVDIVYKEMQEYINYLNTH